MMKMTRITGMLAAVAALALPQPGRAQEKSDAGALFKQLDKNSDGQLTSDELTKEKMQLLVDWCDEGTRTVTAF